LRSGAADKDPGLIGQSMHVEKEGSNGKPHEFYLAHWLASAVIDNVGRASTD